MSPTLDWAEIAPRSGRHSEFVLLSPAGLLASRASAHAPGAASSTRCRLVCRARRRLREEIPLAYTVDGSPTLTTIKRRVPRSSRSGRPSAHRTRGSSCFQSSRLSRLPATASRSRSRRSSSWSFMPAWRGAGPDPSMLLRLPHGRAARRSANLIGQRSRRHGRPVKAMAAPRSRPRTSWTSSPQPTAAAISIHGLRRTSRTPMIRPFPALSPSNGVARTSGPPRRPPAHPGPASFAPRTPSRSAPEAHG